MCLYPTFVKNPKYKPNKKNKGKPPVCKDRRLLYIPVKCGCCIECRKEKQREWRVRLEEELRSGFGYFITLTISQEGIKDLEEKTGLKWKENPNEIATKGLRLFLERCRKDTSKSIKHWCVTELGEKEDRIHLHGIFFGQKSAELIKKHWKYGFSFIGQYCNSRSVNYMTKYMLKVDTKHPEFKQIVLSSKGIGSEYMNRLDYLWQKQNYKNINVATYTFRNGTKMAMPKYYKNKIFTEKEREKMWINNLNRGLLWIYGEKVKADDWNTIDNLRSYWQKYGREVMGDNPIAWNAMKERRKEEKQRKAIAEAKKQAEKVSTENLTELPLQADFPMQEKKQEWEDIINQYIKDNVWAFKRVRRCTTSEHYNALGAIGQA
nr:MAG TPA: Replication associated protein [Microviridae sp.]